MLLDTGQGRGAELHDVFHKWGLDAVTVGYVTGDGLLRVKQHGTTNAEIPNTALADEGPVYQRPLQAPASNPISPIDLYAFLDGCDDDMIQKFLQGTTAVDELLKIAASSPNLCSREWVWEQYDHMVQSN